jgi:hypothetical protein
LTSEQLPPFDPSPLLLSHRVVSETGVELVGAATRSLVPTSPVGKVVNAGAGCVPVLMIPLTRNRSPPGTDGGEYVTVGLLATVADVDVPRAVAVKVPAA